MRSQRHVLASWMHGLRGQADPLSRLGPPAVPTRRASASTVWDEIALNAAAAAIRRSPRGSESRSRGSRSGSGVGIGGRMGHSGSSGRAGSPVEGGAAYQVSPSSPSTLSSACSRATPMDSEIFVQFASEKGSARRPPESAPVEVAAAPEAAAAALGAPAAASSNEDVGPRSGGVRRARGASVAGGQSPRRVAGAGAGSRSPRSARSVYGGSPRGNGGGVAGNSDRRGGSGMAGVYRRIGAEDSKRQQRSSTKSAHVRPVASSAAPAPGSARGARGGGGLRSGVPGVRARAHRK